MGLRENDVNEIAVKVGKQMKALTKPKFSVV